MKLTDQLKFQLYTWALKIKRPLQNVFIEITNQCNLKCKHCYLPNQKQILKFEEIKGIIDDLNSKYKSKVGIAITGGEPLTHPDFRKIVNHIHKLNMRWSLATNGIKLDLDTCSYIINKGLSAITISLDGDKKTHNLIRGHHEAFAKTLDGIENIHKFRNIIKRIMLTTVVHNLNIDCLEEMAEIINKYPSISWRLSPLLYHPQDQRRNDLYMDSKIYKKLIAFFELYKQNHPAKEILLGETNNLTIKHKTYTQNTFTFCSAGVTTCGILANGDIVGCMVARKPNFGNIRKCDTISKIWNSQSHSKRKSHTFCEYHQKMSL